MPRQSFRILGIGFLCLMLVGIVIATEPQRGGSLRIAYEADITGMDPHTSLGI
jgi:hypothetical protein